MVEVLLGLTGYDLCGNDYRSLNVLLLLLLTILIPFYTYVGVYGMFVRTLSDA